MKGWSCCTAKCLKCETAMLTITCNEQHATSLSRLNVWIFEDIKRDQSTEAKLTILPNSIFYQSESLQYNICDEYCMPTEDALRTSGPFPFGTCICSTCWDQSFFQPFIFSGLCTSNIPRYFLDWAWNNNGSYKILSIVAAFREMHLSPAKHSYEWLPRKSDYRTDGRTDRQTDRRTDPGQSYPYVSLCFAGDTIKDVDTISLDLVLYMYMFESMYEISRPISTVLVLFLDFWVSNIPRYLCFLHWHKSKSLSNTFIFIKYNYLCWIHVIVYDISIQIQNITANDRLECRRNNIITLILPYGMTIMISFYSFS